MLDEFWKDRIKDEINNNRSFKTLLIKLNDIEDIYVSAEINKQSNIFRRFKIFIEGTRIPPKQLGLLKTDLIRRGYYKPKASDTNELIRHSRDFPRTKSKTAKYEPTKELYIEYKSKNYREEMRIVHNNSLEWQRFALQASKNPFLREYALIKSECTCSLCGDKINSPFFSYITQITTIYASSLAPSLKVEMATILKCQIADVAGLTKKNA